MTRARLLLATAALGALTLTACSDDGTATDAGDGTTASDTASTSPSPDTTPTDDASTGTSPSAGASGGTSSAVAVPVYFVGDTPGGLGLFREFEQVEGDPLAQAAARVAGGQPLDPDYRSLWPAGGFAGVEHDEAAGRIVLTLAAGGSPDEAVGLSKRQARLAVQQMVYTLQGVTQTRDPLVVETSDGTPTSVFGIDTSAGIQAADELDVLALVNITTPEQGATVSGSFTATGLSSSFEASGPWQLRDGDGTVVKSGGYQAEGWMDMLYPFTTEVDLSGVAPGDYTFAVQTDDPTGGTEGPGPTEDTKAVTVQ